MGDDGDDNDDVDYYDNNEDDDVDNDDDCGYSAPLFCTQFHFQPNLNFDLLAPQSQMKQQRALCKKKKQTGNITQTLPYSILWVWVNSFIFHQLSSWLPLLSLQKCSS